MRRNNVGWMHQDSEAITAEITGGSSIADGPKKARFDRSNAGAEQARDWVTEELGRDDWRLVECGFLGYRIQVPED